MYRADEDVTFRALDQVEQEILKIAEEVAYFCLIDRTGETELQVARIEANAGNLLPYMERAAPHPERLPAEIGPEDNDDDLPVLDDDALVPDDDAAVDENEAAAEAEAGETSPLQEAVNEEPTTAGKPSQRMLLIAACRWIRARVRLHIVEYRIRKYRVRLYSSKGSRVLLTASFVAYNNRDPLEADPEPELPPMPTPGPAPEPPALVAVQAAQPAPAANAPAPYNTVSGVPAPQAPPQLTLHHDVALTGAASAYRHLGDCYTQFGDLVLGSVSSLQNVLTLTNRDLGTQLRESRGQVDTLVGSVLDYKVQELQHSANTQQVAAQDHRTTLARDAIHQLGETAKAFFVSRGIPPNLADVMQSIGSSPELLETLDDPAVREVLRDPRNLQGLAGLLKQVGHQYQAQRSGSGGAPAGYPQPGPNAGSSSPNGRYPAMPPGQASPQPLPQGHVTPQQQLPPGYGALQQLPPGYGPAQQPLPGYGIPQQAPSGYGTPQHYPPGYGAPQQHPGAYVPASSHASAYGGTQAPAQQSGGYQQGYGYPPGAAPQHVAPAAAHYAHPAAGQYPPAGAAQYTQSSAAQYAYSGVPQYAPSAAPDGATNLPDATAPQPLPALATGQGGNSALSTPQTRAPGTPAGAPYPPGYVLAGHPQALRPDQAGSGPGPQPGHGGMYGPTPAGVPGHPPPGYAYGAPPMYPGPHTGTPMGIAGPPHRPSEAHASQATVYASPPPGAPVSGGSGARPGYTGEGQPAPVRSEDEIDPTAHPSG